MKFSVRLLFVVFLFLISLFVLRPTAFAQTNTSSPVVQTQDYLSNSTDSNVPKNMHSLTQSVMIETLSALVCQLTGTDPAGPNQHCLGVNLTTGKIGYAPENGGALGLVNQGITMLYNSPIHTGDYLSYMARNFGIAKPTYAANDGFAQLSPLMNLWSSFRNVTYIFFVFVFVLIGIGIMLRVKIDPRTVMTIQNQIPKIIICLLLITFSYAIAGFLIDLMNAAIYIIYSLFASTGNISGMAPGVISGGNVLQVAVGNLDIFNIIHTLALYGKDSVNNILGVSPVAWNLPGIGDIANIFGGLFNLPTGGWQAFKLMDTLYSVIDIVSGLKLAQMIPCAGSGIPIIGGLSCVGQTAGEAALAMPAIDFFLRALLPYLIIYVLALLAVFATLIRVFIMLLKAYVSILLDVIFAPLWIMTGLVPGNDNSKGFGSWLKDIGANLAVFPAVYGMFILAKVINAALTTPLAQTNGTAPVFVPPLIGNPLANSGTNTPFALIGTLVGFGLILMTPEVAKMIREFIKAPKPGFGAVGAAAGFGAGLISRTARSTAGIYTATQYDITGGKRSAETRLGGIMTRLFR
jgi:hypothetical protein